jgi:hypothetical protein
MFAARSETRSRLPGDHVSECRILAEAHFAAGEWRLTTPSESRCQPIREEEYRSDPGPVGIGCRSDPAKG